MANYYQGGSGGGGFGGTYTPEQAAAAVAARRTSTNYGMKFGFISKGIFGGTTTVDSKGTKVTTYSADIAEQEQMPENPGARKIAVSTYGGNIPISTGRRRVSGNIIWAGTIAPVRIGDYDYYVKVPLSTKVSCCSEGGEDANSCARPNTDDECGTDTQGTCSDIYGTSQSCVNYDTGKYIEFECNELIGGSMDCRPVASNVDQPSSFVAYNAWAGDGGAAQCTYCVSKGIFSSMQEAMDSIKVADCSAPAGGGGGTGM